MPKFLVIAVLPSKGNEVDDGIIGETLTCVPSKSVNKRRQIRRRSGHSLQKIGSEEKAGRLKGERLERKGDYFGTR
jgi:hypothetical protein